MQPLHGPHLLERRASCQKVLMRRRVATAERNRFFEELRQSGDPVKVAALRLGMGVSTAYRGSDGSECVYDKDGNRIKNRGSFNYCANPVTLCHILIDVLPDIVFGPSLPGLGPPTNYEPEPEDDH